MLFRSTASASRDKSVKNVGTDMAKSAQKAARSVNQSRKEEVSTSATSRTSISTSDTSVSVIENINQGRTLNLVFHRLYNRYVGRLFLTDLRLNVRSGTEVIAGSGILPERTYSIHELREVVMALEDTPLPIKSDERSGWELRLAILREIGNLIEGEYAKLTAAENAAPKSVFNHPDPTSSGLSGLLMSGSGSDEPAAPTDIVKFGDKLGTVVDGLRAMDLFSVRARGKGDKLATPRELVVIFNERLEALIEQLAPMEVDRKSAV